VGGVLVAAVLQCLTMDCCGMGRAIEAGFDAAAFAWWIAGAATMGIRCEGTDDQATVGSRQGQQAQQCTASTHMLCSQFETVCA
jgi:hypothetical protein